MLNSVLSNLSLELNFTKDKNIAYGNVSGYLLTFSSEKSLSNICISISESDNNKLSQLKYLLATSNLSTEYFVTNYVVNNSYIDILFHHKFGTHHIISSFINWIIPNLLELNIKGVSHCSYCYYPINDEYPSNTIINNTKVLSVHSRCGMELEDIVETQHKYTSSKGIFIALLGAILGGIITSIPWAIVYYLGFFVGILGFLIGIGTKKGFELFGGKPGKFKTISILVITVLSVILGQFLGEVFYCISDLTKANIAFKYSEIPSFIKYLLETDAEYRAMIFKNIGMGILFGILGVSNLLKQTSTESFTVKKAS